jgi:hypothetical protein
VRKKFNKNLVKKKIKKFNKNLRNLKSSKIKSLLFTMKWNYCLCGNDIVVKKVLLNNSVLV